MITVNGEERACTEGITLEELLSSEGYKSAQVAAALNGRVVRRADYGATILKDRDDLQIFRFMGGG